MIDLEACRVFARVVDEHSFSAAARSLGMSLPAVSKHVARLERELEARLLHRTTRRLSLTEAGTVFHGHCLRLLEDARAAQEGVLHLHDAPRGELRPHSRGQHQAKDKLIEPLRQRAEVQHQRTDRATPLPHGTETVTAAGPRPPHRCDAP